MSCTAVDYLKAAEAVYVEGCSEATSRAAASRAYYAAYHAAKTHHNSLPSPGSVTNEHGSHQQLISQLRHPTVSDLLLRAKSKAVGNTLMAAFALRVKADYEPQQDFQSDEARDALSKARELLEATDQGTVDAS